MHGGLIAHMHRFLSVCPPVCATKFILDNNLYLVKYYRKIYQCCQSTGTFACKSWRPLLGSHVLVGDNYKSSGRCWICQVWIFKMLNENKNNEEKKKHLNLKILTITPPISPICMSYVQIWRCALCQVAVLNITDHLSSRIGSKPHVFVHSSLHITRAPLKPWAYNNIVAC